MKRIRIVLLEDGKQRWSSVRAHVFGPFGVWRDRVGTQEWHVTHIPSGYGVMPSVMRQCYSWPRAVGLVAALRRLDLDWSFRKPDGPRWEAAKLAATPVLHEWWSR